MTKLTILILQIGLFLSMVGFFPLYEYGPTLCMYLFQI